MENPDSLVSMMLQYVPESRVVRKDQQDSGILLYGFTPSMKSAGPEFNGLPTIRYQSKGAREVVFCNAVDLWGLIPEEQKASACLTEDYNVSTFLGSQLMSCTLGSDWLLSLMQSSSDSKGIFHRSIDEEGSALYVPGGVILLERCLNNRPCVGIRVSVSEEGPGPGPGPVTKSNLDLLLSVHCTYAKEDSRLSEI